MERLCFGTYGTEINKVMKEPGNVRVVELLLGLVLDNAEIMNQKNQLFVVTDAIASKLLSCKEPVLRKIKNAAEGQTIKDAAKDYFSDVVIPAIKELAIADLLSGISVLINADDSISQSNKDTFLALAGEDTLADFLSVVFLYTLGKPNKAAKSSKNTFADEMGYDIADILDKISTFEADAADIPKLTPMPVPDVPEDGERVYISALLSAYDDAADADKPPSADLSQHPKYEKDLKQRRIDYFAAETVRRGTRENFRKSDPDNLFNALLDETFQGVTDIHALDYKHGYERLLQVMSHAANLNVDNCLLGRIPAWVGASQKKGVCHMLVNGGRIEGWVIDDE